MNRFIIALLFLLALLSVVIYIIGRDAMFSTNTLLIANAVMAGLTFLSYYISAKAATSDNNGKFVRGVMGGTFLKFFLVLIIGTLYLVINKGAIKVPNIIAMMGIYVFYTVIETAFLSKAARSV